MTKGTFILHKMTEEEQQIYNKVMAEKSLLTTPPAFIAIKKIDKDVYPRHRWERGAWMENINLDLDFIPSFKTLWHRHYKEKLYYSSYVTTSSKTSTCNVKIY